MTFTNHGCNGTFNGLDWRTYQNWKKGYEWAIVTEQNATADMHEYDRQEVYDIFIDRHVKHGALVYNVAKRDIKAGEELLDNYVFFVEQYDDWFHETTELKQICNGGVGFITRAEINAKHHASSKKD